MRDSAFNEFLASDDTLRVYKGDRLLFSSSKERLLPLVDYIDTCTPFENGVTVFDRVVGNAAAMLFTKILCDDIHSVLGSKLAVETLRQFGILLFYRDRPVYREFPSGRHVPDGGAFTEQDPG